MAFLIRNGVDCYLREPSHRITLDTVIEGGDKFSEDKFFMIVLHSWEKSHVCIKKATTRRRGNCVQVTPPQCAVPTPVVSVGESGTMGSPAMS